MRNEKMLSICIINKSQVRISKKFIEEYLQNTVILLSQKDQKKINNKNLTIIFLNSLAAKRLNDQFRKKNYATDVLSFEGLSPDELGELIICPQIIKKQSVEHRLTVKQELGYMLIHGCLHLLGYDHEQDEKEERRMFRLQDRIFNQLLDLV
jgi:probable rRNA maturation factor